MEKLFSGIWWIDALRVTGIGFLVLLVVGFVAWAVVDWLRHRRQDAAEKALLSPRPKPAKSTPKVTKARRGPNPCRSVTEEVAE